MGAVGVDLQGGAEMLPGPTNLRGRARRLKVCVCVCVCAACEIEAATVLVGP